MKKVLLAGGAGYIGSVLCQELLDSGYQVRVVDLLLYGGEFGSSFQKNTNVEFHRSDLRDSESVRKAMQDIDSVVCLVGLVGEPASALNERITLEVNLVSPVLLAREASRMRIPRFVFLSTCSVYGISERAVDEGSPLNPVSLYAWTKAEAEARILAMETTDFSPIVLRLATVYGMSPRPRLDSVVNKMTANAVTHGCFRVFGGYQKRPLVHVRDVAKAIILALKASRALVSGHTFNVGANKENFSVIEIADCVRSVTGAEMIVESVVEDPRNYNVVFDHIRRSMDYECSLSVEMGVVEIKRAIEVGVIQDPDDIRYDNYKGFCARLSQIQENSPVSNLAEFIPTDVPKF